MILRDQCGNQIPKYCATPDKIRDILPATAKDLGPKGRDIMFGAGLADACGALMVEQAPVLTATPRPASRASTGAR
jgi:hypothetical protein